MADCVRVGVRLRPPNARERAADKDAAAAGLPAGVAWEADGARAAVTAAGAGESVGGGRGNGKGEFRYDFVFEGTAKNGDVYEELGAPVVESALAGYNGTVFAYGQTSSGKTHSMLGDEEDPGVTPRAVAQVMRVAAEAAGGRRYSVRVTYCEIYNEVIRDLLNPDGGEVRVRENARGQTFMDAREVPVATAEAAMAALAQGQAVRAVGETAMNATSSRSHTIFTLIVQSVGEAVGAEKSRRESFLHLVDLAGSERAKSTHASGARLREGSHINKSLLTLGTIINKLSDGGGGGGGGGRAHLPYRDSKLTRVLRDALGGNSRTAVLCAVTPSVHHAEETLSTLKFAERAKNVTNAAVKNETVDYKAKYREALAELEVLRAAAGGGEAGASAGGSGGVGAAAAPEALALNVDLHRAREEVAALRERAEAAETAAAHAADALKNKAAEVRALRAEAGALAEEAHTRKGKEDTLQLTLGQAFFKLEDVRRNIQLSRKKGSRVLRAEEDLYAVSVKLAMFVPDEMHEEHRRREAAAAAKARARARPPQDLRSFSNRSAGSTSGGSVPDDLGDPPSPRIRASAAGTTLGFPGRTRSAAEEDTVAGRPGVGAAVAARALSLTDSPVSPDGSEEEHGGLGRRRAIDGGGVIAGSPRDEDGAIGVLSTGRDPLREQYRLVASGMSQRGHRRAASGPVPASPVPVLRFDECEADAAEEEESGGSDSDTGDTGVVGSAMRAWKNKPSIKLPKSFSFLGTPPSGGGGGRGRGGSVAADPRKVRIG